MASKKSPVEKTSVKVASSAGKILRSKSASPTAKTLAASALSQRNANNKSSKTTGSVASKVLNDPKSTPAEKSLAASTLTQAPNKKK